MVRRAWIQSVPPAVAGGYAVGTRASIPGWLCISLQRARRDLNALKQIRPTWIKARQVFDQVSRNIELVRSDAFDDALRQLVTAIVVVMRVVIRRKRTLRWLSSPRFVQRLAHHVEIDQRHAFF